MAVGHNPPVTGTVAGTISPVGQIGTPPKVGVVGTGAVNVGTVGVNVGKVGANVGKVGVKVGVNVGTVGVNVGTVGTIMAVGQSEIPPPPKVGAVGTGAVNVGTVGVNVGKVGVKVGRVVVNVGAVGSIMAVGHSEIPPIPKVGVVGTGALMVGVIVGTISAVTPGAVVTVVITAKPVDEIKIKIVIINKLMRNN